MLELHCHTTYSDGSLTPTQLVSLAAETGVGAIAITDHDTIGGWSEAMTAGNQLGVEIVPGIELSTVHNGRSLHILGYYPIEAKLVEPLQRRIDGRRIRAQRMAENLAAMGYPIELPPLQGSMVPARPHIARAMLEAGYVNSPQEAFERFIGEDKPAYVHYEKFSIVEGIALLKSCGAVPVWAHPYLFRGGTVEETLTELVEAGLMGIEVYHPHHKYKQIVKLKQYCEELGLIMTGGSDYHGPDPDKQSKGLNYYKLPLKFLTALKAKARDLHAQLNH